MSVLLNLKEFFKDAFLPPVCPVCGRISTRFLCESCAKNINFLGDGVCTRCGNPLPSSVCESSFDKLISDSKICFLCKDKDYNFYRSRSFTDYNDTISKIILKYKYRNYHYLAELLVNFLGLAYENYYVGLKIDFLDTVPQYNEGNPGYLSETNHMNMIAEKLSAMTGIPFARNVIKIRKTYKQQVLDKKQREINLRGAFKTINCLKPRNMNFLIVDDVWTTGSTLNEVSLTLKKSGADKVYLLTIARRL